MSRRKLVDKTDSISGGRSCFAPSKKKKKNIIKKPKKLFDYRMTEQEQFELSKRFNAYSNRNEMTREQFKNMMGVIGETYFARRMFSVIDKDDSETITLDEYLTYNDVLMHGTEEQKHKQNFKMLDIHK